MKNEIQEITMISNFKFGIIILKFLKFFRMMISKIKQYRNFEFEISEVSRILIDFPEKDYEK